MLMSLEKKRCMKILYNEEEREDDDTIALQSCASGGIKVYGAFGLVFGVEFDSWFWQN